MITVRVIPAETQPRKEGEPTPQSVVLEPGEDGSFSHPTYMDGMIVKQDKEYPEGLTIYLKRDHDCLFDIELSLLQWATLMETVSYGDKTIPKDFYLSVYMHVALDEPTILSLLRHDSSERCKGWEKLSDIEINRNL